LGYEPAEIVPAVLPSEFITGVMAGLFHQEFGNVNLRPGDRDFKVTGVLTGLSVVGVLAAVIMAVNIPSWMVKAYIGILVLGVGLSILKNHNRQVAFSWSRIAGLGFLAAFSKGINGGGYGPVVAGGQVLAGIRGRSAVGIASLAEGMTSAVGVMVYLLSGVAFPWHLAPSLLVGAMLSMPLAAYVVSKMPTGRMTLIIGGLSTALGSYTLIRVMM
jgi:uncharacterized membrane protein YfcA